MEHKNLAFYETVALEAITWWKGKCPARWTVQEHLRAPSINCQPNEKDLAQVCASLVELLMERETDVTDSIDSFHR